MGTCRRAKRVCEAVVEARDEGLCVAGERSGIRRRSSSSSSWGEIFFCIIKGGQQQGVSTIQSLTRHHPLPIHKSVGCPRCTEDIRNFQAWFTKCGLVCHGWWWHCVHHTQFGAGLVQVWSHPTFLCGLCKWKPSWEYYFLLWNGFWWSWLCDQLSPCQKIDQNSGFLYPKVLQYSFPLSFFSSCSCPKDLNPIMPCLGFRVQAINLATPICGR